MRGLIVGLVFVLAFAQNATAERIANPVARFTGLDKITGAATAFAVKINEEYHFGRLIVTPFVCYTRPVTEEPKTTSFVQIERLDSTEQREKIFSGWMFAENPGLNALADPTYDVWLTGCFDPNAPPPPVEVPATPETAAEEEEGAGDGDTTAPAD